MSKTDMVRCKSLVEATRVAVVDLGSKQFGLDESDAETGDEEIISGEIELENYEMDVARVYEQTIMQLGELLGASEAFHARLEILSPGLQCGI